MMFEAMKEQWKEETLEALDRDWAEYSSKNPGADRQAFAAGYGLGGVYAFEKALAAVDHVVVRKTAH